MLRVRYLMRTDFAMSNMGWGFTMSSTGTKACEEVRTTLTYTHGAPAALLGSWLAPATNATGSRFANPA